MAFSARINTRKFKRAMDRAPRRLSTEMAKSFVQHALAFDAHMKKTRFASGGGGGGVQTRTGKLARSMGHVGPKDTGRVGNLRMRVFIGQGVAKRYARVQEYGGTIRPTSTKYLTVPLPDNLTAANKVPRYKSARALMGTGRTFITRSKAGNLVIGLNTGRKGALVKWLWILKRQVRLRPRLGFIKTFNGREMRDDRIRRFNAAVRRALRPASGGKA